jgi:hypothetical protein
VASAQTPVEAATTSSPVRYIARSPTRATSRPEIGANSSRNTGKALTTAAAAVTPTPKLRANTGSAGATIP